MQDTVEHTSKAFLGVTLNCARCHDHMYDPIAQKEYYRVRAIFEPHKVRTDRVPGQPDIKKDGLPRVYDADLERADVPVPPRRRPHAGQEQAAAARRARRRWAGRPFKVEPVDAAAAALSLRTSATSSCRKPLRPVKPRIAKARHATRRKPSAQSGDARPRALAEADLT